MNLQPLYDVQRNVDLVIARNTRSDINELENIHKRVIAFKVEVAEFANEISFFKYWKQSHEMDKAKTLEELADCMAFLLSIGISRQFDRKVLEINPHEYKKVPILYLFNYLFKNELNTKDYWQAAFENLICIGLKLGLSIAEMEVAYYTKSGVNIERQKARY
ncbi:hypothetical protein F7731_08535 [Cytobacillus depressus]|uniref:dUTPase n=1 Tax=Cytobacillus depressus TaxID=1602942 RepID=A0A6L3V867_9BACI|nr:dUTP diphosphatase [Cytobacillus depressus]KAB2337632.1 hypothetical protein F7731_08535 [Cytobacillus depressus]